jgi:hypothetical protein
MARKGLKFKSYNRFSPSPESEVQSLKDQIEYMRIIGCHKLADLLVDDLELAKAKAK